MIVSQEALERAIADALKLSKKRNFKESVDITVVLKDINLKGPEGRIREVVELPHPPNKEVKICVVADGDMALKAQRMGLRVITKDELQQIDKKKAKKIAKECDWVLVKVDLMGLVGRILGPALGPRGKAPVPVPPNAPLEAIVRKYQKSVNLRVRKQPQVMCRIGTEDMDVKQLAENAQAVISALERKLPNPQNQIAKVIVKTTMGPPVLVTEG
ncbi:50S ribosomal protein L1 [Ignicoccus pacificus DSM 13166]|uniref:Large ribosomal subunit protein uL1 n=1 Tax=Ignicoccus pacificus DSM 13166 TaxID=940294 RepID=A0A977KAL5_9CREN|nr:50S ribosomal protein L1 [Ignicoccus pacificus DSM 13166]